MVLRIDLLSVQGAGGPWGDACPFLQPPVFTAHSPFLKVPVNTPRYFPHAGSLPSFMYRS